MSVSSADLARNLGNMSAAMSVGGNTMEESIGLLTGITEITRSAASASRALVTIQSRFNQIVDESSSTGQSLLKWYTKHGIAVKDDAGQLRSLYDVMSDLAPKWNSLSKNEQSYFMQQQAGKFVPQSRRICGKWLRALATWKGNDRPIVTTLRIA